MRAALVLAALAAPLALGACATGKTYRHVLELLDDLTR